MPVAGLAGTDPGAGGAAAPVPRPDWTGVGREAADLLQRYVRIPSVNPPADTREASAFLREVLEREGVATSLFESAPGKVNLLARLPATVSAAEGRGRAVLLLHHMDVVPVDPARWSGDPFGGEIREGLLHGRGALDMKATGIMHVLALLTLKRQNVPLGRDLLLLATADEETGGHDGARWMIERHWQRLEPEYVLDEGGFGARDVLGADGRLVFGISVGEKTILWTRVRAAGTAGHGSQPIPDNAGEALVRALAGIAARPSPARLTPVLRELVARVGPLADNTFTRAIQSDTVTLTSLRAGVGDPPKANVIPSAAEATLDCRLLPDTDPDVFLEGLRRAAGEASRVDLEPIYRMDETPVTPHETPLFAALERAIRAEHPDAVVAPILIPYGTDSNAFRLRGSRAYGLTPMVLDAGVVASMHGDAERVPVAELERGARILYRALVEIAAP